MGHDALDFHIRELEIAIATRNGELGVVMGTMRSLIDIVAAGRITQIWRRLGS